MRFVVHKMYINLVWSNIRCGCRECVSWCGHGVLLFVVHVIWCGHNLVWLERVCQSVSEVCCT